MALGVSEEELEEPAPADRCARAADTGDVETLDVDLSGVQARLLEDPTRQAIVAHLEQAPGLNVSQLRRRVDAARNTVEFHLRRLARADLVVTKRRDGGHEVLCFLATDASLWEREATRVLYGRRANRQVALYVAEHPGSSTTQIAEAVDREPVTVLHHLKTLREHGLVERLREGNEVTYFPSPTLARWIQDVDGDYQRSWPTGEDADPG